MQCNIGPIFAGGDSSIVITALRNEQAADGEYINNSSIAFVLYEYDLEEQEVGDVVIGGGGNLSYQSGTNGEYFGTISKNAALEANTTYWLVVTDATYGVIQETDVRTF